jgi:Zn-finger nucleic acid-binding protein
MAEDSDGDMPEACAVCGVTLTSANRSDAQPDMCKVCAGETEEQDQVDDFK